MGGDRQGRGRDGQRKVRSGDRDVVEDTGADMGRAGSDEEQDEPDRGGDPKGPHAQQSEQEPGRYYPRPGVTYRPVTGVRPSQVGVAWRPAADTNPVIQDFVRCCLDNKPAG
jgi:hypothetical protein